MTFPAPVPEIPAANVDKAAAYYVNTLGFTFDWGDDQGGIAGISRGNCRLFITNRSFRESYGNIGPILFWLNLDSKAEVDELFAQWKAAQAKIVSEPEDKPWKLRYSNRGRCSGCTRRRMDRACPGVFSIRPLRSRVLIIS